MPPDQILPHDGIFAPPHQATHSPARIGPYHIIEPLGEGGMGVVYLAEQHEPVHRDVALKVLRAGAHTHEIVARFESERHALALMDHPNITRVFDAGATADGLPYFVMERVVGVPITEYAVSHRLTTEQRLRLIVQVCRAVQHAHQKGIIHRDIKPSNVLVAEVDGAPLCKVIDFGIAKAISPKTSDIRITATGMVLGTPAYMSPEQFMSDGADIDTRSDIYSLGVMLYELLAGVLPFDPGSSGFHGLMAQRATGDINAPSVQFAALELPRRKELAAERATDPDTLRRAISGDLDSIVLKTLEEDRELRYASASALAADLEHYLANEPVSARPPSATYRLRKFVRRHRAGVFFASTLLILMVAVAIGATIQARRLALARSIAVSRQQQAEEMMSFMLGDLRTRLGLIGRLDLLDEVGRHALAYFAAVPEEQLSTPEKFRRSVALWDFAGVKMEQGKLPDAARLMEQALADMTALSVREPSPSFQIQLGHEHFTAGQIDWLQGDVDKAAAHFEQMVRISHDLNTRYPDSLTFRAEVAYALNNIGQARERRGDTKGALKAYLDARAILDSLVVRDTTKGDWLLTLGVLHNAAGVAERKLGDLDAALRDHQEELAIKERLLRRDPANADWQRAVGIARIYLSDIRMWRGDVSGAMAELVEGDRVFTTLVARDSINVSWRASRLNNQGRMAQVWLEQRNAAPALSATDRALAELARLVLANPANVGLLRTEATIVNARARALMALGRMSEAASAIGVAIAAGEQSLVKRPGDLERRKLLADSYLVQGDLLASPSGAGGAVPAWARALVLVDSLARTNRETDFLALQAGAMMRLGGGTDAKPVVDELLKRGYRRPSFLELMRAKGMGR